MSPIQRKREPPQIARQPRMRFGAQFDESYYLHGRETGKSLYEDYRWLPDLTIPMARRIVEYCGIQPGESINDFGCARGYLVKALMLLGHRAVGQDISDWAVAHADPDVRLRLTLTPEPQPADWTIAKDVLEHIPGSLLDYTLYRMVRESRLGVFIIVPLAGEDGRYVIPEYEQDVTHCQRLGLHEWRDLVLGACHETGAAWDILCEFRVPGIKDNWAQYDDGNGFILARRQTT